MRTTSRMAVVSLLLIAASICNAEDYSKCWEAYDRTKRIYCDPTFDRVCLWRAHQEQIRCVEEVDARNEEEENRRQAEEVAEQERKRAQKSSPTAARPSHSASSGGTKGNRLFVAYANNEVKPFVVSDEAMLRNVVSSYINRRTADYSEKGGPPRMQTEECVPRSGAGPYFAFIHYYVVGSSGWGVACGAASPKEAVQFAQRACESRGGYCRIKRGRDKENAVELLIGDLRIPGNPQVIENFSVRLKETRPNGGAGVGDVINYDDTWHNIPEGFVCSWKTSWGDHHQSFLIHANGPFYKKHGGYQPKSGIDFTCSSFLPLF